MHRFNLCHDLLDRVRGNLDGQALVYVYLRFSAIRQLAWQRNYNTKPRELAHAQERLTGKLAEVYREEPASRPLARLMLATVGRGGEGLAHSRRDPQNHASAPHQRGDRTLHGGMAPKTP